jgi:hypothetical protein
MEMQNEQQQQQAVMGEKEFLVCLSMFRPEERAQALEAIRAAVKGGATA